MHGGQLYQSFDLCFRIVTPLISSDLSVFIRAQNISEVYYDNSAVLTHYTPIRIDIFMPSSVL